MAFENNFESGLGKVAGGSLALGVITELAGIPLGAFFIPIGVYAGLGWVGLRYCNPFRKKSPQH